MVTFGLGEAAGLRARRTSRSDDFGSTFTLIDGDRRLGEVALRVPGAMNVQNALAAIAVGRALDLPFRSNRAGLGAAFAACDGASTSWSPTTA